MAYNPAALRRPVADVERVHELVLAAMRAHREAVGPGAPETDASQRVLGMFRALMWLDGEPVGPFSDGPADSVDRVLFEARLAERVVKGRPSRMPVFQAVGFCELLRWAAGRYDELPGFAAKDHAETA